LLESHATTTTASRRRMIPAKWPLPAIVGPVRSESLEDRAGATRGSGAGSYRTADIGRTDGTPLCQPVCPGRAGIWRPRRFAGARRGLLAAPPELLPPPLAHPPDPHTAYKLRDRLLRPTRNQNIGRHSKPYAAARESRSVRFELSWKRWLPYQWTPLSTISTQLQKGVAGCPLIVEKQRGWKSFPKKGQGPFQSAGSNSSMLDGGA